MLTRALFGVEPDVPGRRLQVDPVLPEASTLLRIEDMPLACTPITIETDRDALAVRGRLPPGLALIRTVS